MYCRQCFSECHKNIVLLQFPQSSFTESYLGMFDGFSPTSLLLFSPFVVVPKVASSVTAGVASSLSEKIVDTLGSSRPSAPLTSVQIRFIQNMIQETLDDCREACHKDIVNLQVEMIKQFHIQLNEIHSLLERYSVNEGLVAEVERLREENKRLRTHF